MAYRAEYNFLFIYFLKNYLFPFYTTNPLLTLFPPSASSTSRSPTPYSMPHPLLRDGKESQGSQQSLTHCFEAETRPSTLCLG